MKKRISGFLLALILLLSASSAQALPVTVWAAEPAANDIVIFYTNDIHTYIDNHMGEGSENGLTYSKIAALKDAYPQALLVDAGDHIQGTAYGQMDSGQTIIDLMNAAGYDLATLGNHEFDYGQEGRIQVTDEWADFPYISANFYHEKDGTPQDTVLDSYQILEANGKKIAFVGITTPETITSSAPSYFQDENGAYIYGIAAGSDGSDLYKAVQTAINQAQAEGADHIIALGHLGMDPSSKPWTSQDVIANTAGLDAFIDGHSHTVMEQEMLADKDGNEVLLTQTGSYLNAIGRLVISPDGTMTSALLDSDDLAALAPDKDVLAIEDAWIGEVNDKLGEVIGYSEVTFDNYDSDGNRLVRRQSTNTGDFAADALYYLFDEMEMDVDAAVMNGGGIRNAGLAGELSYLDCKEIHPFGNVACLLTVTGQQLLDALEWGSKDLTLDPASESGSFLHVSGLTYTLDLTYDSTVQADDKDVWTGPPTGEYRVKDVQILDRTSGEYKPLDLDASYNLAGYNYTLRDLGGGFAMLNGAENVLDYVAEDYMVLANYIQSFPANAQTDLPTIKTGDGYDSITGSGRITIVTEPAKDGADATDSSAQIPALPADSAENPAEYTVIPGDCLWNIAKVIYGNGKWWNIIFEANTDSIQDPSLIFPGQVLKLPALPKDSE